MCIIGNKNIFSENNYLKIGIENIIDTDMKNRIILIDIECSVYSIPPMENVSILFFVYSDRVMVILTNSLSPDMKLAEQKNNAKNYECVIQDLRDAFSVAKIESLPVKIVYLSKREWGFIKVFCEYGLAEVSSKYLILNRKTASKFKRNAMLKLGLKTNQQLHQFMAIISHIIPSMFINS